MKIGKTPFLSHQNIKSLAINQTKDVQVLYAQSGGNILEKMKET